MRRSIHPLVLLLLTETNTLIFAESGKSLSPPSHVQPKHTQDETGIIKNDSNDEVIEIFNPIDFSYQYSHESGVLVDEILEAINASIGTVGLNDEKEVTHIIEVDIFSSKLKDKGISKFIEALCEQKYFHQNYQKKNILLHLLMGMNDITCLGASRIFEKLVQINNITTSMKDTVNNTNTTKINDLVIETSKSEENSTNIDTNNITSQDENLTNITESTNQTLHTNSTTIHDQNITDESETFLENENQTHIISFLPKDAELSENQQLTVHVDSIDMTFNNFGQKKGSKTFNRSLRKLVESGVGCPQKLDFSRCCINAVTCRSIGKGMMNRFNKPSFLHIENNPPPPISINLSGNPEIGDLGVAALAAAIRLINQKSHSNDNSNTQILPIFYTLDLSSCEISDVGAVALAMALEGSPGCVQNLILSNNRITDEGATALGNSLNFKSPTTNDELPSIPLSLLHLNLDNNIGITNEGAISIAAAMRSGAIRSVTLRSCAIGADGAIAFGEVLSKSSFVMNPIIHEVCIDLSGNHIGTEQPKKKKKGASLLKSKASATTASYINFIGKKIQGGLKDVVGVDVSQYLPSSSLESDDDFEASELNDDGFEKLLPSKKEHTVKSTKCGARGFADQLINAEKNNESKAQCFKIGMRSCFLDKGGANALAAAIVQAKEKFNINLEIDASMNNALDSDVIFALSSLDQNSDLVHQMSKEHMDLVEALRIARKRAEDARAAYARENSLFDNERDTSADDFEDSFMSDGFYDDYNNYDHDEYNHEDGYYDEY